MDEKTVIYVRTSKKRKKRKPIDYKWLKILHKRLGFK
jgi:hypothetical protein